MCIMAYTRHFILLPPIKFTQAVRGVRLYFISVKLMGKNHDSDSQTKLSY